MRPPPAWLVTAHARRLAWAACIGLVVWATVAALRVQMGSGPEHRRFRDFYEFFSGARALAEGGDVFAAGELGYVYPPLLAAALLPMVGLGIDVAGAVWTVANAMLLLAMLYVGARAVLRLMDVSLALAPMVAMAGAAILGDKIIGELKMQQSNVLMLAGWTLGLWALSHAKWAAAPAHPAAGQRTAGAWRVWLAGLAIGVATNLKYVTLIAPVYFILRGRATAAVASIVGLALFAFGPALIIGWTKTIELWRGALGGLVGAGLGSGLGAGSGASAGEVGGDGARVMRMSDFGISVTTSFLRAGEARGWTWQSPALVLASMLAVFALAWAIYARCGASMWARRFGASEGARGRLVLVEWTGLIVVALAFSPQTNTRHLIQALPLAMMLAAVVMTTGAARVRLLAGLAAAGWFLAMVLPVRGWMSAEAYAAAAAWWVHVAGICWAMTLAWLVGVWCVLSSADATKK